MMMIARGGLGGLRRSRSRRRTVLLAATEEAVPAHQVNPDEAERQADDEDINWTCHNKNNLAHDSRSRHTEIARFTTFLARVRSRGLPRTPLPLRRGELLRLHP